MKLDITDIADMALHRLHHPLCGLYAGEQGRYTSNPRSRVLKAGNFSGRDFS